MSRNGDGSLEDEDRLSLCSSCRSELRSIYSLGVPSSLDESSPVSGAPSVSQDRAVAEDDNGRKSMQSGTASASRDERDPKPPSKHGDDLAGAMTGRTSADGRNAPTRVTLLTAYEAQKLRNVTYERVYRFVNLRRGRAEMVGRGSRSARQEEEEEPKLPGVVGRSCVDLRADDDAREPAERVESAIDARSMERRDGIRDPSSAPTSTSNVKKVEASKMPVGPESAGSDLGNRRRNLYKLAVRVSELRSVEIQMKWMKLE